MVYEAIKAEAVSKALHCRPELVDFTLFDQILHFQLLHRMELNRSGLDAVDKLDKKSLTL